MNDINNRLRLKNRISDLGCTTSQFAKLLGINHAYLFNYINHGVEPTKLTKKGRDAREALGILDKGLMRTRARIRALDEIAKRYGWASWSAYSTAVKNGQIEIQERTGNE